MDKPEISENIKLDSSLIFCHRYKSIINEGKCLSIILGTTNKEDLITCREKCDYGIELRESCPFNDRWKDYKIDISNKETVQPKEIEEPKIKESPIMVNANLLKEVRNNMGLSQKKLAEILGVTPRSISRWETGDGKISDKNKENIIKKLKLSNDYFQNY